MVWQQIIMETAPLLFFLWVVKQWEGTYVPSLKRFRGPKIGPKEIPISGVCDPLKFSESTSCRLNQPIN